MPDDRTEFNSSSRSGDAEEEIRLAQLPAEKRAHRFKQAEDAPVDHVALKEVPPDPSLPAVSSSTVVASGVDAQPLPAAGSANDSMVGEVIGGHYVIMEKIGGSATTCVYKALHMHTNQDVAIKVISLQKQLDDRAIQRLRSEARAACHLNQENIASTREYGFDQDGNPFLVMDFAQGESLARIIEQRKRLPVADVIKIAVAVAKGLAHAHEHGVVHREIDPGKIMVYKQPDGSEICKIVGFGIARSLYDGSDGCDLTKSGEIDGNPLYMSPEQCLGGAIDKRSDIYSMGCVMYEALSGRPPFQSEKAHDTLMMHVNDKPAPILMDDGRGLEAVVLHALEKDPAARYQSGEELRDDLFAGDSVKVAVARQEALARMPKPSPPAAGNARLIAVLIDALLLSGVAVIGGHYSGLAVNLSAQQAGLALFLLPAMFIEVATALFSMAATVIFLLGSLFASSLDTALSLSQPGQLVHFYKQFFPVLQALSLLFLINWLYHALTECSPLQGTLGKVLTGLRVETPAGTRIGFGHATLRHFCRLFSGLTLGLTYFLNSDENTRVALHDRLSSGRVVWAPRFEKRLPSGFQSHGLKLACAIALIVFSLCGPILYLSQIVAKAKTIEQCSQLIANNANDFEAYARRAALYYEDGLRTNRRLCYEKAIDDFTHAIALKPSATDLLIGRARAESNIRRWDEAIKDVTTVTSLDEKNYEAMFLRGQINVGRKQYHEAIRDFTRAIEIERYSGQAFLSRAQVEMLLGFYRLALDDASQAIARGCPCYEIRAEAYCGLRQFQSALDDFNRVLHENPQDSMALAGRAHALNALGEYERALKDATDANAQFMKGTAKFGKFSYGRALAYRAEALVGLRRYEEAIADASSAIAEDSPARVDGYIQKARAECALGKYAESLNDVNAAIKARANNPDAYRVRAQIQLKQGNEALAQEDEVLAQKLQMH